MSKALGRNRRRNLPAHKLRPTPAVSTSDLRAILFKASGPPAARAAGAEW
jgi:hypothetical protein